MNKDFSSIIEKGIHISILFKVQYKYFILIYKTNNYAIFSVLPVWFSFKNKTIF